MSFPEVLFKEIKVFISFSYKHTLYWRDFSLWWGKGSQGLEVTRALGFLESESNTSLLSSWHEQKSHSLTSIHFGHILLTNVKFFCKKRTSLWFLIKCSIFYWYSIFLKLLGNIIASTTRGQFQNNSPFNFDGYSRKWIALIKFSHPSHSSYSHHSLAFWIVPESPRFIVFFFLIKNPSLLQLFDKNKFSTCNIGSE